ncbi:methionine ABC transporter permease [Lactobacillus selangorensis]|nr:methionine ABC transporter permease [Lactobacillus selangorensis]
MTEIARLMPNVVSNWSEVVQSTGETIYMTIVSGIFAGIIGLILGIALVITQDGGILANKPVYQVLDKIVNLFRSIPFIILLAVIGPFTRLVVGTTIGTTGVLVPLIVGCAPFYARQVQNALLDVAPGIIEAAESVGAGPWSLIFRVYLREGAPDLVRVSVVTIISLIGLTTMAGVVGGGGLGNLAVSVGYQRFENDITLFSTLLILIMVFLVQGIGDWIVKKISH